jgi:hypothetical protein
MGRYCFDTNAFMTPWNQRYPIQVFPSLWNRLSDCASDGTIISPDEVYREIQKHRDPLYQWVKDRKRLFQPVDAPLAQALAEIMQVEHFARMVETGRNAADPWVVALARVTGRTVVTEEGWSANPVKNPKIPNVCEHFNVRWIPFVDFLRETGWSF